MVIKSKPTLYFIRGLPGAGKSTFARTFAESLDVAMFEADTFFYDEYLVYKFNLSLLSVAHENCQEYTKCELADGYSCVVSNTSTTEKEVKTYKDIADQAGANFVSLIIENRHGGKSVHNVPEETIAKMQNRFSIKL